MMPSSSSGSPSQGDTLREANNCIQQYNNRAPCEPHCSCSSATRLNSSELMFSANTTCNEFQWTHLARVRKMKLQGDHLLITRRNDPIPPTMPHNTPPSHTRTNTTTPDCRKVKTLTSSVLLRLSMNHQSVLTSSVLQTRLIQLV